MQNYKKLFDFYYRKDKKFYGGYYYSTHFGKKNVRTFSQC